MIISGDFYLLGHLSPKPGPPQSSHQPALLNDTQPQILAAARLYYNGFWCIINRTTQAYTKNIAGSYTIHQPPHAAHTPPEKIVP